MATDRPRPAPEKERPVLAIQPHLVAIGRKGRRRYQSHADYKKPMLPRNVKEPSPSATAGKSYPTERDLNYPVAMFLPFGEAAGFIRAPRPREGGLRLMDSIQRQHAAERIAPRPKRRGMAALEWEHRKRPRTDEKHDRPKRRAASATQSKPKMNRGRKPRRTPSKRQDRVRVHERDVIRIRELVDLNHGKLLREHAAERGAERRGNVREEVQHAGLRVQDAPDLPGRRSWHGRLPEARQQDRRDWWPQPCVSYVPTFSPRFFFQRQEKRVSLLPRF